MDGQIHASMDRTIELECASRGEGANALRTVPVDLYIRDVWRTRLFGPFWRTVFPCPIGDDVRGEGISDQCHALSLFYCYR